MCIVVSFRYQCVLLYVLGGNVCCSLFFGGNVCYWVYYVTVCVVVCFTWQNDLLGL